MAQKKAYNKNKKETTSTKKYQTKNFNQIKIVKIYGYHG